MISSIVKVVTATLLIFEAILLAAFVILYFLCAIGSSICRTLP